MTKKHFIALADVMKRTEPIATDPRNRTEVELRHKQWCQDVNMLADFCQSQNSRFNRARWFGYIAGTNGPNGGAR